MADEPRDATPEEIAQENALRHFEAQVAFRQSNILPMDAALNVGMFYGLLIRAKRPRNGIERAGFFFMGTMWASGLFPGLPFSVLVFPLGLKLIWTACRPAKPESE
jgi:hypothetical protein